MEVFCLCREPYDEERFMIACDACDEWYHLECIGLSEREGKLLANSSRPFICSSCERQKRLTNEPESTTSHKSTKECNRKGCRKVISRVDSPYCDECMVIYAKDMLKRIAAKKNSKIEEIHHEEEETRKIKKPAQQPKSIQAIDKTLVIRQKVRETFEQLFLSFEEGNASQGRQKDEHQLPSKELADRVEKSLFEALALKDSRGTMTLDKRYTQKAYSLQFNLKKNEELRKEICSGQIGTEVFVRMSSEELASKELTQWRQDERKRSLMDVVLGDGDEGTLIKKTHKGEEPVVNEETEVSHTNDDEISNHHLHLIEPSITHDMTMAIPVLRSKDVEETISNSNLNVDLDSVTSSKESSSDLVLVVNKKEEEKVSLTTTIEPSKVTSESVLGTIAPPPPSQHSSLPLENRSSYRDTINSKQAHQPNLHSNEEWEGMISFAGFTSCQAVGYHVGGSSTDLRHSLSSLFHIQGRIDKDRAETYISQLKHSSSKDCSIWLILPANDQEKSSFMELHNYYQCRDKYAVVDVTCMPDLIDFYLLTINENDTELPESVRGRLRVDSLPKHQSYMLAVVVISRRGKESRNSMPVSSIPSSIDEKSKFPSSTSNYETPLALGNTYSGMSYFNSNQHHGLSTYPLLQHGYSNTYPPSSVPLSSPSFYAYPHPMYHQNSMSRDFNSSYNPPR